MKKTISWAVLIIALLLAVQTIAGRKVRANLQPMLEDARWKEAVTNYKKARERGAPKMELEQKKREIGRVFQELRSERV